MFQKITLGFCAIIILTFTCCKTKPPVKTLTPQVEHLVELQTTSGPILLRLYDETPLHRDNMIKLVKEGFYDQLLFHRVIKDFMIQGGDPSSKNAMPDMMLGNGDVGYKIPAEFNQKLVHIKGALAAARDNNPDSSSSGCQFYIVQGKRQTDLELDQIEKRIGWKYTSEQREKYKAIGGTPQLDGKYTVYGEVVVGLETVDKIANVLTSPIDRPTPDVRIVKANYRAKPLSNNLLRK